MENNQIQIQPELLTIPQVCELVNIKRATFYKLNCSGAFAPLPIGLCRKVLYQRAEVENWISNKCPHRRQWLTMQGEKQ
jgi:predicted DNA-binding transcriptional regulator AlpA